MRGRTFLFLSGLLATPASAQPQALGIFGEWGAFRDPAHCWAIAEPYRAREPEGWRPFAAVGFWPRRNLRGQVHLRLSREKRPGSAVLLRIDGRLFQLRGGGRDAWASDAAADQAIREAMRTGVEMNVETRSVRGTRFRDHYRLRGAATAIDAAGLACLPRRR